LNDFTALVTFILSCKRVGGPRAQQANKCVKMNRPERANFLKAHCKGASIETRQPTLAAPSQVRRQERNGSLLLVARPDAASRIAIFAGARGLTADLGIYLTAKGGIVFGDFLILPDRLAFGVTFESLSSGETPWRST
jgi:hypothetical protein